MPLDDVTNLDLLAAILDGEREQRDALWQMAKEIVRLTEVLEGQDNVLTEIAEHAGVNVGPALSRPAPIASIAAPAPPPPAASTPLPPAPAASAPAPPPAAAPEPERPSLSLHRGFGPGGHGDMARLREELEAERALVERLREAKLQLEHRAADAEAALEERSRQRRSSVIRRLLGPE